MNSDSPEHEKAAGSAVGQTAGLRLSAVEARILGCLLEKERTTPEVYPLTLNSLVNACNQTSNRDPIVHYEEPVVQHGLEQLRQKKLAAEVWGAGARVLKFRQTLTDQYDLGEGEFAIICVLLLRGPQTVAEIRTRTDRLHTFFGLAAVEAALAVLMRPEDPLAGMVPAGPGQKEDRYLQLLSVHEEQVAAGTPQRRETILIDSTRLETAEREIHELKGQIESLREEFARFRKQFE